MRSFEVGDLKGHDFSRAENATKQKRALAPEGTRTDLENFPDRHDFSRF
jgi:hypothetical protein